MVIAYLHFERDIGLRSSNTAVFTYGGVRREIELSQLLGRTAKLGTENQHDSSSKQGYNLCFYGLLRELSLLREVAPPGSPQSTVGGAS